MSKDLISDLEKSMHLFNETILKCLKEPLETDHDRIMSNAKLTNAMFVALIKLANVVVNLDVKIKVLEMRK